MEILFLLPTVFVLSFVAVYNRNRKLAEREVEWKKNKDKDYRY